MEEQEAKISQIKVEETPPNCPVCPPCPVPPKIKPGKAFFRVFCLFLLALILAAVVLVGSGIRIVRKESLLDLWLAKKQVPTPTETFRPVLTTDPTANWKTYTNTDFRFNFKYPSDFSVENTANNSGDLFQVVVKETGSSQTSFGIIVTKKYLPGDIKYYLDSLPVGQQEIAGESWNKYCLPDGYGDGPGPEEGSRPPILAFRIEKGEMLYTLDFTRQKELTEIQKQILSTFKFSSNDSALKSADSQTPVAGICSGSVDSAVVNIDINGDTANPRCVKVTANQQLQITNNLDKSIQVSLGQYSSTIQPKENQKLGPTFATYLAPGVHSVVVTGGPGPEIWLQ